MTKQTLTTCYLRGLSPDQQHAMFNMLQATFQQNEALRQDMKTLQTQNYTLLNHVSDMKDVLRIERNLPAQVLLQQPVILHDALGRTAPFHLDFIDSVAAFLAVLRIRFEHVGRPKITRMEFDLRDTARQSPIALRKTWQGIFRVSHILSHQERVIYQLGTILTNHSRGNMLI